jgi:hypothetical protein
MDDIQISYCSGIEKFGQVHNGDPYISLFKGPRLAFQDATFINIRSVLPTLRLILHLWSGLGCVPVLILFLIALPTPDRNTTIIN